MTIYSLYIFDRHCTCVFYQDWHRKKHPKPALEGGILPAVSHAVTPRPVSADPSTSAPVSQYNSPRNTLSSATGVVVALGDASAPTSAPARPASAQPGALSTSTGLSFDEEAKLVYGVILSLRNMIKKMSARDEQFVAYRTSTYKLHLFETLTGYKFIMLSDPQAESLRFVLRQIYAGPFLEYVVRNPLVRMDSRERGIDNEWFRTSVDRLVGGLSVFA